MNGRSRRIVKRYGCRRWRNRVDRPALVHEQPTQDMILAETEERTQRHKLLGEGAGATNEREREILVERRLRDEPLTLEDLGQRFHVSRERIGQPKRVP